MLLIAALLSLNLTAFAADEAASNDVVFVVDCSGSMRKEDAQYASRDIYLQFLEKCDRDNTSVGLVCFTNLLESSSDKLYALGEEEGLASAKEEGKKIIYPSRDTDIALGLREAMRLLDEGKGERKLIVFIGDGVTDLPNGPRTVAESERELEELLKRAQDENTVIYSVGMNGDGNANTSTIEMLASETGGMNYTVHSAGEAENVVSDIVRLINDAEPIVIDHNEDSDSRREKKSYSFDELYGSILQKFAEIEPIGSVQTIENSFADAMIQIPEITNTVPEEADMESASESSSGNIFDLFLSFFHGTTKNENEGDVSGLEDMMGGDVPADELPEGTEGAAPGVVPGAVPSAGKVSDYYLVVRTNGALSGLRIFTNEEDKRSDFITPENGLSIYRLGDLGENWSNEKVYLEFTGAEGSLIELYLLNADFVDVVMEIDAECVKPSQAQNVRAYATLLGEYSTALTELLDASVTLRVIESEETVPLSGEYGESGFTTKAVLNEDCHVMLNAELDIDDGILNPHRVIDMSYNVCENPVALKNNDKQNMFFFSSLTGGTLLGKTIKLEDVVTYEPSRQLSVRIDRAKNITCDYDAEKGTIALGGGNAYEVNTFFVEISDGFATVKLRCSSVTIPAMLVITILLVVVLIAAIIFMAAYNKKHTKFIGKLFLKFRLPEKMSDYAVADSELIFPYTSSISLWDLIVLNNSMHMALSQIIDNSELEAVAKGVMIESRSKGEIWLKIKQSTQSLRINEEDFGKKKDKLVVLGPEDSATVDFGGEGGDVRMIVYRNPNTVKSEKVVFTEKKIAPSLDEKTENARQKLSMISEEAVDTVKNEKEEKIAVSFNECVNYYVFASVLGMLKQDREGKHIRLYRDTVDFSPVTLIDSGIIDNDIYYLVFTKFCTNLDRQRRESLDSQMRALLDACAADDEKAKKTQKQAQSMIMNYTALLNMVQDSSMEEPDSEKYGKVIEFYSSVIDVCKQLLGKLDI